MVFTHKYAYLEYPCYFVMLYRNYCVIHSVNLPPGLKPVPPLGKVTPGSSLALCTTTKKAAGKMRNKNRTKGSMSKVEKILKTKTKCGLRNEQNVASTEGNCTVPKPVPSGIPEKISELYSLDHIKKPMMAHPEIVPS